MTTVLNFNILNVFGLQPREYSFNDRSRESDFPGERQDRSAGRVIDVTPQSRVVSESEAGMKKDLYSSMNKSRPMQAVKNPSRTISTYDRQGNPVECCSFKGVHFDAYV